MATALSSLETQVRLALNEATASYWTSAELINFFNHGIRDLRRAIANQYQDYFLTVDATNVTVSASTATLSGVPADVGVVKYLEARDLTSASANRGLYFVPCDLGDPKFRAARGEEDVDPTEVVIYYHVHGAGGPIAAPTITIAPQTTSAVNLTLAYWPSFTALISSDNNPIPGESDQALIAYGLAFARAKEIEGGGPDPAYLAIYKAEKDGILASLAPRNQHMPRYVEALFESEW